MYAYFTSISRISINLVHVFIVTVLMFCFHKKNNWTKLYSLQFYYKGLFWNNIKMWKLNCSENKDT